MSGDLPGRVQLMALQAHPSSQNNVYFAKGKSTKNVQGLEKNWLPACSSGLIKKIREIAEQRNDNELLAIMSDELIAKEAHWHASCYRTYTKFYKKTPPGTDGDSKFSKVWELLIDRFENPKVEEFKNVQSRCESDSQKKNLKHKTDSQTDMFQFLKVGKEHLIYPSSLKIDA